MLISCCSALHCVLCVWQYNVDLNLSNMKRYASANLLPLYSTPTCACSVRFRHAPYQPLALSMPSPRTSEAEAQYVQARAAFRECLEANRARNKTYAAQIARIDSELAAETTPGS